MLLQWRLLRAFQLRHAKRSGPVGAALNRRREAAIGPGRPAKSLCYTRQRRDEHDRCPPQCGPLGALADEASHLSRQYLLLQS